MRFYTYAGVKGKYIHCRYIDEDGQRRTTKEAFKPTLFVKSGKESPFKNLLNEQVSPVEFSSIREAKDFIEEYKDVENYPIYGESNFEYQYIAEQYPNQVDYDASLIKGFWLDIEVYTPKTASYSFPRPEEARSPIVSIALYDTTTKKMVVWGTHPEQVWSKEKSSVLSDLPFSVSYLHCKDEHDLLDRFIQYWSSDYPDYISAWNGEGFDFPYIVNRIENELGEEWAKRLSPFGSYYHKTVPTKYGQMEKVVIRGVASLDYMDLYKKHTFITRESYALDFVAEAELGKKKLEYDTDINTFYEQDYQGYIDYNIHDTALIYYLEEKLKLFEITFALAYYAKVNYADTLGTVKIWEVLLYHFLKGYNIVPPVSKPKAAKGQKFAGAYVKDPLVGFYRWIVSVDLNSLYPHLIQQYNLGAETLIEPETWPESIKELCESISVEKIISKEIDTDILKKYPVCLTANGYVFKTNKVSYLSQIMRDLYAGRKADKKQMIETKKVLQGETDPNKQKQLKNKIAALDNLQMAKKILLNGGYGAIGNPSFKFFDIRVAEAITLGGQLSIKWIGHKLDAYFNKLLKTEGVEYVVYQDTDSCYIACDKLVEHVCPDASDEDKTEFLNQAFQKKILPYISSCYEELAEYLNCIENRMFMEREIIAPTAIWTKKKRYCAVVTDSEGVRYEQPELKVMGLEAVRSEYPRLCRETLKRCYRIALTGSNDDLIKEIDAFRKEYNALPLEQIAFATSCNNMEEYTSATRIYKKGTPIGVKAALIHNHQIRQMGLTKRYQDIKSGDKIRYVLLKEVNPFVDVVLGFIGDFPPEFELERYIDRKAMFQKGFLTPLQNFLDCINWKTKKESSLEDYF